MWNAHSRTAQLQKIERRLPMRQCEEQLARQIFPVIGIEMQRLEVVAEVHRAQRRRAAGKLGKGDAQRQRAEDPVLLGELGAPVVFLFLREMFEAHECLRAGFSRLTGWSRSSHSRLLRKLSQTVRDL